MTDKNNIPDGAQMAVPKIGFYKYLRRVRIPGVTTQTQTFAQTDLQPTDCYRRGRSE